MAASTLATMAPMSFKRESSSSLQMVIAVRPYRASGPHP
jgi:hypothetical protein